MRRPEDRSAQKHPRLENLKQRPFSRGALPIVIHRRLTFPRLHPAYHRSPRNQVESDSSTTPFPSRGLREAVEESASNSLDILNARDNGSFGGRVALAQLQPPTTASPRAHCCCRARPADPLARAFERLWLRANYGRTSHSALLRLGPSGYAGRIGDWRRRHGF